MAIDTPSRSIEDFINRELSWLSFNERVLALAEDVETPLLERVKFVSIFASNLDEFYMVRVAGLKQQQAAGLTTGAQDRHPPGDLLREIGTKVLPLARRHAELFVNDLIPSLSKEGIEVLRWDQLDGDARNEMTRMFREEIFPVLTPLAVDPGHPFPYISNLSLNLAVQLQEPKGDKTVHFARVKVPPILPRFVALEADRGFVPLEDVISANLDRLFPGMKISEFFAFRVTRNADLDVNDDGAEDLLLLLEEQLARRRFTPAVRLEVDADMPPHLLDLLLRELEMNDDDVHRLPGPLGLAGLGALESIDRPDLRGDSFHPVTHKDLTPDDEGTTGVLEVLRAKDILVHHPYESFTTSVERFIDEAAADPRVLAIKQTLYRTSGDSPIVEALIEAAEAGKQVVVLVEIKARFDERANIAWARSLEKAGCHVVYGLLGLKTHAKLCLVVRQESDGIRRYVHVGTGNYNPKTARIYEDLGILTSNEGVGAEVSELFNYLTGYSLRPSYRHFIVAPQEMRERLVEMIHREMDVVKRGGHGYIAIKVNSLVDETVIAALYEASENGVKVDLLVRGICSLRPGKQGVSSNIRVRSVLGRFLEHSRIFYFRNGGKEEIYTGSADIMERNLDRRVEVLLRVPTAALQDQLKELITLAFRDNCSSWALDHTGEWTRRTPGEGEERINYQEELMRRARARA